MSAHVTDWLSAYLDDEVEGAQRAHVEEHLRDCRDCQGRLDQLAAVDAAARELSVDPPEGYFDSFSGRVRERIQASRSRRRAPAWTWALAAGLLLAVLTPLAVQERGTLARPAAEAPPAAMEAMPPRPAQAPVQDDARAQEHDRIEAQPPREEAPAGAAGPPATLAFRDGTLDRESRLKGAGRRDQAAATAPAAKEGFAFSQPPAANAAKSAAAVPPAAPSAAIPPAVPAPPPPAAGLEEDKAAKLRKAEAAEPARSLAATRGAAADSGSPGAPPSAQVVTGAVGGQAGQRRTVTFEELRQRSSASADEARALRDAWRTYAREHADDPRADQARVHAVEAAAAAYRLSHEGPDREVALLEAQAYLARPDARDKARVRVIADELKR